MKNPCKVSGKCQWSLDVGVSHSACRHRCVYSSHPDVQRYEARVKIGRVLAMLTLALGVIYCFGCPAAYL